MDDLGNPYNDDKKIDEVDDEPEIDEENEDELDDVIDDIEEPESDDDIESINSENTEIENSETESIKDEEETKGTDEDVPNNVNPVFSNYLSSDDSEDEEDDDYLQKFDEELRTNFINKHHPETSVHNYEEVKKLATVVRDVNGTIVDQLHRTIPIMTKYEATRILGQRAKQIETGAKPLIPVNDTTIDSYVIAENELREKKIPFIIRRPIPNGGFEYWYAYDLELLH